ncbi:MAG: bifunctional phosphopantothenoylcysteine decarboxylase/phosphopantothenate--cysteine ligase CoaBC [Methanobacteriota archaeon]|nr:MAG: bifunctional phosphopantothenoylcysteine decarboxylase/phosphopantothenate--cysteine ligase CoaBC [Euryarchaeota archaeon]
MELKTRSERLAGRRIALCVTGSVAAVESVRIARELRRHGAEVIPYMTKGAMGIIHPNALEFAAGRGPVAGLTGAVEHLADHDLILIAPATANTIAKIVHGIADNPVTALAASSGSGLVIAPAMHREMYENPVVAGNMRLLRERSIFVEPLLEEGAAKMAPLEDIVDAVFYALTPKDLKGRRVVVTAGPTMEHIDPVRVITNRSSGKMGVALAREAVFRGADVTLIYGPGTAKPPSRAEVVRVETSDEMLRAVESRRDYDIFIGAAAVADFTVEPRKEKLGSREGGITLELMPTKKTLSVVREGAVRVAFKAGYGLSEKGLIEAASMLMEETGFDLVVANDLSKGVLGSDEAEAVIVKKEGVIRLERMDKQALAKRIFDELMRI